MKCESLFLKTLLSIRFTRKISLSLFLTVIDKQDKVHTCILNTSHTNNDYSEVQCLKSRIKCHTTKIQPRQVFLTLS